MKIITWNVNRFNGNSMLEIWDDAKERYFKEVFEYINSHDIGNDDIVLFQEFPCQRKNSGMLDEIKEKYEILSWYDLNEKFGKTENRSNKIRFRTIAIVSKKSNWNLKKFDEAINFGKDGDKFNYVNRYVHLINEKKEIELLGIHMPARDIEKDKPDYGIEELINAIDNTNCIPHIIVGDFNAGDYQKNDKDQDFIENRENYNKFVEKYNYIDVIKNKKTTNYRTPTEIDHVLIKEEFLKEYELENANVDYKELSDHYPIIVKLKMK